MRTLILALAITLAGVGAVAAGTIENAFGNTLVVRAPSGDESRWLYNEDGTYLMHAGQTSVNGSWTQVGLELCMIPAGGERQCYNLPAEEKHVGDSWTAPGADGETTILIIAGR